MISVCKNASRYHSVCGIEKSGTKKKDYFLIDILLRSLNPPLLSIDVATFIL